MSSDSDNRAAQFAWLVLITYGETGAIHHTSHGIVYDTEEIRKIVPGSSQYISLPDYKKYQAHFRSVMLDKV